MKEFIQFCLSASQIVALGFMLYCAHTHDVYGTISFGVLAIFF